MIYIKKTLKLIIYSFIRFNYKLFNPKKIWFFSSWNGELYSDNPKYLFEYINNQKAKDIVCIWLTQNEILYRELKKNNIKIWLTNRWTKHLAIAIVDIFFYSDSPNPLGSKFFKKSLFVNLWHGMPIKNIGIHKHECDYFIVTNPTSAKIIEKAFTLDKEKIKILGQAKNDGLFTSKKLHQLLKIPTDAKIITYIPTYRGSFHCSATDRNNDSGIFIREDILENENYPLLVKTLEKHNAYIIIKPHIRNKVSLNLNSRIIVLDEFNELIPSIDNYEILGNTDILISDFSSLILDFFITNKPMLFYAPDWREYISTQNLYFDYSTLASQRILENYNNLILAIHDIIENDSHEFNNYKELRNKFNTFQDNNHCSRIYNFLKNKC